MYKNKTSELEKLELKRALYIQNGYILSNDSLFNEEINPEFRAIDMDLFQDAYAGISEEDNRINEQVKELLNGRKITL